MIMPPRYRACAETHEEKPASADGTDRPELGDDGILRYRGQWVALSPRDVELLEPMIARFDECIRREELLGDEVPLAEEWAFNARLKRLRVRLRSLGLSVTAVRGRGFVLTDGNGTRATTDRVP